MRAGAATMTYAERKQAGLVWSEWWYLAATLVATIVAVDPLEMVLIADPLMRHLALALAVPALLLTLVGTGMRAHSREQRPLAPAFRLLWPLLALGLLALGGSLYARYVNGVQSTFLNVGVYMLTALVAAVMVLRSGSPTAFLRAHIRILLAGAVIMGLLLIENYRGRQVYHEQIFLVIPMAVLFFARSGSEMVRWAGCLFFLAMAWLSAKYTSYLIGAATAAWLALMVAIPRLAHRDGLRRTVLIYWTCALGGTVTLGFVLLGVRGAFELPTGNVEYRSHTYMAAFERFLDSPAWGTLFAVESVEKFTLYSIGIARNMLATHSDVLDLLANGGVLGVGLWCYAMFRIGRLAWAHLLQSKFLDFDWAPYAHTLAVMSIAGVITYTFNPILLQPSMAYLIWTNLGLLAGLALRMQTTDANASSAAGGRRRGRYGGAPIGLGARSRA
jgi:hypothetical protein